MSMRFGEFGPPAIVCTCFEDLGGYVLVKSFRSSMENKPSSSVPIPSHLKVVPGDTSVCNADLALPLKNKTQAEAFLHRHKFQCGCIPHAHL